MKIGNERSIMLKQVADLARTEGLVLRGAFEIPAFDRENVLSSARTLVLLGWTGTDSWDVFASSPEANDGNNDALDRWSRRVIDRIATKVQASALYPFDGPPWFPFQRWAQLAEPVFVSPLRILIHPDWGLWHSYRGALSFADLLEIPARVDRVNPCSLCEAKPCLLACPVSAFSPADFEATACATHISSQVGESCVTCGCRARNACPIGVPHRYTLDQAAFHMRAFRSAY